jgi:GNAT superfamily N-acetyltransferase
MIEQTGWKYHHIFLDLVKARNMPSTDPKEIILRDIEPEDLEILVSLLQQLWPAKQLSASSLGNSFRKSFALDGHIIRCACFQGTVVGICSLSIRNNLKAEGNLANIDELVVEEKMRGKEIGKLLLRDAERIAMEHGCTFMGLESSFHRMDAHRFYEDNGYWKQGYYLIRDLE